ncbi:MAG: hypothetical protein M3083_18570 [Actinomycetota bacterium]|nr:hypothetical protein [Actinomycetota bacterium]
MAQRRPWNRWRKVGLIVLVLAAVTFLVGLVTDEALLKIIAPVLMIAAGIINIVSIPSPPVEPAHDHQRRS